MRLAAIDIGTNSVHLVIAEADHQQFYQIIDCEKEMVKLGEGVFSSHQINQRAFQQGLATVQRYVKLADQRGADEILTAATSAIREARNGGAFLDALVQHTGIAPEVISGSQEALQIGRAHV